MMKEQVIITKISIKRKGERKHFQIKLPKNSKFILGVEYGGRLIEHSDSALIRTPVTDPFASPVIGSGGVDARTQLFKRNQLIGELKLQSCEKANWFFAVDVFASDANLGLADFSQGGFPVKDYTHGNKRTEEIVKVDAESTIIQGWYLDSLGKTQKADIKYEVNVYVWINVEE
ncbi:MAG: hypothetical protein PSX36_12600 [bacterium]|nr:hypothetical protein [bacterium]